MHFLTCAPPASWRCLVEVTQRIHYSRHPAAGWRASTGTLSEPGHDPGVTPSAAQAISVVPSNRLQPFEQEIRTMRFPGLPAAKTVEQAILLAQLQILRQMEKTHG